MDDNSHMTFGKYGPKRGDHRILKNVPAGYILWLWDEALWNNPKPFFYELREYIKENYRHFLIEAPDYIPQHPPMTE